MVRREYYPFIYIQCGIICTILKDNDSLESVFTSMEKFSPLQFIKLDGFTEFLSFIQDGRCKEQFFCGKNIV